jgi:hypothetical protein
MSVIDENMLAFGSCIVGFGILVTALLALLFRHPNAPRWTRPENRRDAGLRASDRDHGGRSRLHRLWPVAAGERHRAIRANSWCSWRC